MNGVDILSKTISNEILISKGKLPKFVLNVDEEDFLKSIVTNLKKSATTIYNTAQEVLISNGETKAKIWDSLEELIVRKTHGDWNKLIIGTNLKRTKNPEIPIYTAQWIIKRLHDKGVNLKIYNPQIEKLITGYNIYHVTTLINSMKDVNLYLDFNCYDIPLKYRMRYETLIFSL